ncbi:hypothetical protein Tco_1159313, partial [Tanacetum coccineum]
NMKQGWCGQAHKDLLLRAASATSVKEFEKCMLELKAMNPKAHKWLNKIPPEHWVFNSKIVGGRDKPVITLLEYIKEYCMKRIVNVQSVIKKYTGPLTPTVTRIMKSIKKEAHLMKVQWNGANKYQVSGSLACWNMALNNQAAPPLEAWVNPCYWLTTRREIYSHKVGRPRKKRKRSKHEDEPFVKDGKLSRKGRTITCQSCGNTWHNKAACKGQGRKATTGGNNAEAIGVGSQGSSDTRWTKRRVRTERISPQKRTLTQPASQPSISSQVLVSETRNADGREMADDFNSELMIPTSWSDESKNEKGQKDKGTEVMKDKVSQEHVCEEEVPLNNNIGKQSGDLVEMPSEAVEQGMDDHVPDEIDGAKCEQVPNHVVNKGNLEVLVCKQVANHGGDELVDKGRPLKRKMVYAE